MVKNVLYGDGVHDDTEIIQKMLDNGGYVYLPAGKYLVTRPLIIHSNTHFNLDPTTLIKLADNANCSILDNDGLYNGMQNENITVEGGIWDGNNYAQQRKKIPNEGKAGDENEDKDCDKEIYISNVYLVLMLRFVHVKGLCLKNLTLKDPTSFAVQIADVDTFSVENIRLDYNLRNKNMDGIHIQGPAKFGYIHNVFGNANDDHVALCANGTTRSAITRGAIEFVTIDGIYCDNGYTGVRLLSRGDPVRNIKISNIHGAFRYYAVSFTHHYPLRDDMPISIENVSVSDVFVYRPKGFFDQNAPAKFDLPFIFIEDGVNCRNVSIEKIFTDGKNTESARDPLYISETAKVENLVVRDVFR